MSKQHTEEFKQEAVRLATTSPQPIVKTARDLGIKEATLYNWVSLAKNSAPIISNHQGNQVNLIEELNRLRKENARLKEEREILKKAAVFCERVEIKFMFINENCSTFSTQLMCEILNVSRAVFYAWRNRPESARKQEDKRLVTLIKTSFG